MGVGGGVPKPCAAWRPQPLSSSAPALRGFPVMRVHGKWRICVSREEGDDRPLSDMVPFQLLQKLRCPHLSSLSYWVTEHHSTTHTYIYTFSNLLELACCWAMVSKKPFAPPTPASDTSIVLAITASPSHLSSPDFAYKNIMWASAI